MSTMVITGGPTRTRPQVRRPSPTRAEVRPELRLTRRGRLVVTLVMTALVLVAFLVAGGSSVATRQAGDPAPIRTVEVQEGQTLWSIASEIAEPGQIRNVVYTIERLNSLPDATLTEGQVIAVPATAAQ